MAGKKDSAACNKSFQQAIYSNFNLSCGQLLSLIPASKDCSPDADMTANHIDNWFDMYPLYRPIILPITNPSHFVFSQQLFRQLVAISFDRSITAGFFYPVVGAVGRV